MAFNSFVNGENAKESSILSAAALDSTIPPASSPHVITDTYEVNSFLSPIIPCIQTMCTDVIQQNNAMQSLYKSNLDTSIREGINHERIKKSHWVSDYAKDIYNTLRESELNRYLIHFQSPQITYRPTLLEVLKIATQTHKLGRCTLHLAAYFVDCFMDHYSIRHDKLKLIAISFLILAAKVEEADINMPKFADLNKLVGDHYYLCEFKHMEKKALRLFNFNLMHPTIVTFAELFSNSIITVDDCHYNVINCQKSDIALSPLMTPPPALPLSPSALTYAEQYNSYGLQNVSTSRNIPHSMISDILNYCPRNNDFAEMRTNLIGGFFELIDLTLMYQNLINVKPSLLAASCIAAVRQINGIHPIWNQRLTNLTDYTVEIIMPFVEAVLAIYRLQKDKPRMILCTPQTPTNINTNNIDYNNCTFCDSPDSGIVLGSELKYYGTDNVNDRFPKNVIQIENNNNSQNDGAINNNANEDYDDDDESYYVEYPLLIKRRRMQ